MSTWLILGSSPYAPDHLQRVADEGIEIDKTITCNRGGNLIDPDYFFVADRVACKVFYERGKELQAKGTRLLTLYRQQTALNKRGVDHYDEFVRNGVPYEYFSMSGPFCIEYAIRGGATTVYLAGMTGYIEGDEYFDKVCHFDGPVEHKKRQVEQLNTLIEPLTQTLVDKYPEVQFNCLGPIRYSITGDNWHVR